MVSATGKRFALGDITFEPGDTMQSGWSTITVSSIPADSDDGLSARLPDNYVITATGAAENTGMGWKSEQKNTAGRDWGSAPSLVEGVPATIHSSVPANAKVQAWCLDDCGQRKQELPIEMANGAAAVRIGPKWKDLVRSADALNRRTRRQFGCVPRRSIPWPPAEPLL